ncbi:MAG TPA: pentapeptide repeat-containing protein [Candidatus Angelobacter sp.]|nr:pentapeptide repeat-containing protein [Candidatus Angelobacter sp.]
MAELNDLETKATSLAQTNSGTSEFWNAVQALDKLKQMNDNKKPPVWPSVVTPLTALLAVVLTALTLTNQVNQASTTLREERNAREDQQWTEILGKISLKDPSAVQVSAFGLESFFDSERHGPQARDMIAAILPFTDSNVGFEAVWKSLVRHTQSPSQQDHLVTVAGRVSTNLRDLFSELKGRQTPDQCPKTEIAEFLNRIDECYPSLGGKDTPEAKRGWLYSWEVDSATDAFAKLWHDQDKHIGPAGLRLSGLIFSNASTDKVNFRNLDFSKTWLDGSVVHSCDISGANFTGARFNDAELHDISGFQGSIWEGANWWDMKSISSLQKCKLINYLNGTYPPKNSADLDNAKRLGSGCDSRDSSPR